jgi:hypothetical protein
MAVALPLVSIAGGVAGLTAATTTLGMIAAGASIVGGVAALTGNSDLAKVAGVVALGAGVFSAFATPAEAAASSSGGASTATEATLAASRGNTAIADVAKMADVGMPSASVVADAVAPEAASASSALAQAQAVPFEAGFPEASLPGMPAPTPTPTAPTVPGAAPANSLLDKVSGLGKWMKENKELVNLAGGAAYGAFGPESRLVSLRERALALQQEELERQRRNANNIVGLRRTLTYNPTAGSPIRTGGQ